MVPSDPQDTASRTIHASCVAFAGRAVLILGPSGSGKSVLALMLLALGGRLVADDRTILTVRNNRIIASAPDAIAGRIEARFVGILPATPAPATPVALVVDRSVAETDRLPPERKIYLLGESLPLLHNSETGPLAAAIVQYFKHQRD